jgi:hypothetical protein
MKVAFLTETQYYGKWPPNFPNTRTEVAWQIALDSYHYQISNYKEVNGYDHVFIIFPKGMVHLNAFAVRMSNDQNPVSDLLRSNFVDTLKENNKKVHFVQEGPHWLWNDYEVEDQINYLNMICSCDSIFCHNSYDVNYYLGLFPGKKVNVIPTLLIQTLLDDISANPKDKTIIGGNFARWYGGFESYTVASVFNNPIWAQDSHAKRNQEPMMENLTHFPRLVWLDWMKELSTFKYAVHLMPTVAAGTFSLNCAYFGIPCIGNAEVDTQNICHPDLSIDISDIIYARKLAESLRDNKTFYDHCSKIAKDNYHERYSLDKWKNNIFNILNSL